MSTINNKLEISGIIDSAKGLVLGNFGEQVSATHNSKGKARRLDTVVFVLTSLVKKEYEGEAKAPVQMSLADKLRMKGFMEAKGGSSVDYSVRKNSYWFEVPKNVFEELVGTSYEDTDLTSLVGSDANQTFSAFVETPHKVRRDDILAETFNALSETEKANYQAKEANGTLLTSGGQQIYTATFLDEVAWGMEDSTIKQEQDLSLSAQKAQTVQVEGKA